MYSNGHVEAFSEDPSPAGSLRVNLKMDVTTSGVHDGLMITTGIQTPGSGGGGLLNGFGRSMAQKQCQDQPAQQFWPWQMPTTMPMSNTPQNLLEQNDQAQRLNPPSTPAILPPSRTSTAVEASEESVRRSSEAFLSERENGGSYELDAYKRAESVLLRSRESVPSIKRNLIPEAISSSNIKLNLFENDSPGRSVELVPSFGAGLNGSQRLPLEMEPTSSGIRRPAIDLEHRPQPSSEEQLLLNDSTTTTTTLEVFRGRQSPTIDWFRLPPGPLTPSGDPELVASRGPGYERSDRAETRFADGTPPPPLPLPPSKAVQWANSRGAGDRSFDSASSRHYYTVREPPSTASLPRSPIAALDASWAAASTSAHSTPHSSQWDLMRDTGTVPMTTIVRRQSRERSTQQIIPTSRNLDASQGAMRIMEPSAPPRPPKRRQQQPQVMAIQPEDIEMDLAAPPRPTARKPQRHSVINDHATTSGDSQRRPVPAPRKSVYTSNRSQSAAGRRIARQRADNNAPSPPIADRHTQQRNTANGQAMRSASSNEIFKLYQTRDALGRVLYEI